MSWVLTRSLNNYNQDGDYLVTVFTTKPSITELNNVLKGDENLSKWVHKGGGRQNNEGEWYHLSELKHGEIYGQEIKPSETISKKKQQEILKYNLLMECDLTNGFGICRKFLNTKEIKTCNIMVKEGLFEKGLADERQGTTTFFLTDKGRKEL